mgnify:CR=1 FL=1
MKLIYGAMGDAAAGEKEFNKCKACHAIVDDAGEMIQRGGQIGPNLYNVVGRQAGSLEDFRYGDSLVEAGENGLVWDQASLAEYLKDPTDFLRTTLDDNRARSNMAFKLRKGSEDVAAYLASVSPDAEAMSDEEAKSE